MSRCARCVHADAGAKCAGDGPSAVHLRDPTALHGCLTCSPPLPSTPRLYQELTTARLEHSRAQTALMAKDAELERKNMENSSLQADKASLDKLLQVRGCPFRCTCS